MHPASLKPHSSIQCVYQNGQLSIVSHFYEFMKQIEIDIHSMWFKHCQLCIHVREKSHKILCEYLCKADDLSQKKNEVIDFVAFFPTARWVLELLINQLFRESPRNKYPFPYRMRMIV